MDHCYSHSQENLPLENLSCAIARDSRRPGNLPPSDVSVRSKDGVDHSYSNLREHYQQQDHSYFQYAKKTPLVHQFRVNDNDKRRRSTPLVSRDHTYVRALQLRQNSELCSPSRPPSTEHCSDGSCNLCQKVLFDPISDHSYNHKQSDLLTTDFRLKPQKITSWSDHTYMTFG